VCGTLYKACNQKRRKKMQQHAFVDEIAWRDLATHHQPFVWLLYFFVTQQIFRWHSSKLIYPLFLLAVQFVLCFLAYGIWLDVENSVLVISQLTGTHFVPLISSEKNDCALYTSDIGTKYEFCSLSNIVSQNTSISVVYLPLIHLAFSAAGFLLAVLFQFTFGKEKKRLFLAVNRTTLFFIVALIFALAFWRSDDVVGESQFAIGMFRSAVFFTVSFAILLLIGISSNSPISSDTKTMLFGASILFSVQLLSIFLGAHAYISAIVALVVAASAKFLLPVQKSKSKV